MTGFGGIETRGLMMGVKDGRMYCYFPMPFDKGLKIELLNESGSGLSGSAEVVYEPVQSLPKDTFRFHAWWRRQNPTITGESFPILEATGSGHWCGISLYMEDPGGLGFLEGDEQLWIDGLDDSHYHGTGTEDYFNGGWYFGAPVACRFTAAPSARRRRPTCTPTACTCRMLSRSPGKPALPSSTAR